MNPHLASIFTVLMLALAGCAPAEKSTSLASSERASESSPESPELTYEPAYPADVSGEGLDADDVAQQAHSHGDEEHSHGDGDHGHDGDHSHGDDHDPGEATHTHGDEESDHDH